jgi:hypothetical protein
VKQLGNWGIWNWEIWEFGIGKFGNWEFANRVIEGSKLTKLLNYTIPQLLNFNNQAFTTFPLRKQEVHTRMRLVAPLILACTGRRFTFHRRLVTLWAWLILFPNCGPLPQISHTCAMNTPG